MTKGLLALVLGTAIAFSPAAATPARADAEDVLGVLIGLAALGVIAKTVTDRDGSSSGSVTSNSNNYSVKTYNQNRVYTHRHDGLGYHRHHRSNGRSHADEHERRENRARRLPDQCLRTFEGIDGNRNGFGVRCLNRNYRHAASLPNQCRRSILTDNGRRVFYGPRCLRRAGYRFEALNNS